jgi:hypothetical protein
MSLTPVCSAPRLLPFLLKTYAWPPAAPVKVLHFVPMNAENTGPLTARAVTRTGPLRKGISFRAHLCGGLQEAKTSRRNQFLR